jgi:TPR repeat protein
MPCRSTSLALFLSLLVLGRATASLAGPYEDGAVAFQRKDYDAAMRHWRPLAEAGNARAQSRIAALYYSGFGIALSYEFALAWCEKAADQGDASAQYMLASMYRDGKGAERDGEKALSFFLKAADQGVPGAQYSLGLMHFMGEATPVNYAEAYYWLGLAATAKGQDQRQLRATAAFAQDQVAQKLSAEQIADAKRRIDERKVAQQR